MLLSLERNVTWGTIMQIYKKDNKSDDVNDDVILEEEEQPPLIEDDDDGLSLSLGSSLNFNNLNVNLKEKMSMSNMGIPEKMNLDFPETASDSRKTIPRGNKHL
jgi:hypothetical protein